ncbi:MAG: type II toxin-antitoxin system HicB family antitoxin [Propionibacteriaceae bacterium]|jgi:hypothetical protein|nr:type II toxin-antitoxin system HicB family antitoxin [Propionibacteriaceae bacterium]
MKSAISIPEAEFTRFDAAAKAHHMSRSEFYRRAGARYLAELEAEDVTRAIDEFISRQGQDREPWAVTQGRKALAQFTQDDEW